MQVSQSNTVLVFSSPFPLERESYWCFLKKKRKDNYFSEWKEKKQGLDNMLHAVLLIKFDEFIVILYQQEKNISFIG